jgi:Mrp family chromosome partitioning ATPase
LFVESVKAEFENLKSNITLIDSDNIIDSADASIKANDADAIILFATFGKTRVKDIEFARDEMKKTGKDIVGVIINNAKHK